MQLELQEHLLMEEKEELIKEIEQAGISRDTLNGINGIGKFESVF